MSAHACRCLLILMVTQGIQQKMIEAFMENIGLLDWWKCANAAACSIKVLQMKQCIIYLLYFCIQEYMTTRWCCLATVSHDYATLLLMLRKQYCPQYAREEFPKNITFFMGFCKNVLCDTQSKPLKKSGSFIWSPCDINSKERLAPGAGRANNR